MKTKGMFVVAVVLVAALAACGNSGDDSAAPKAAASTAPAESSAKASAAIPEIELPEEASEDAKRIVELNKIIAEVTQEAINRPKDQRMSTEEVSQLIRTRIEEIGVRP